MTKTYQFAQHLTRIDLTVFNGPMMDWRNQYCTSFNVLSERAIVGALILKEFYSYSDNDLIYRLELDPNFRGLLQIGAYFDRSGFLAAYVAFGQIAYKYYKKSNRDIISESLLDIAPKGELTIELSASRKLIHCEYLLRDLIHKNVYRFLSTALEKLYRGKKVSIDFNLRNKIENILHLPYNDIAFSTTSDQLINKLNILGEVSYALLQQMKSKDSSGTQLRNYFDKYFHVKNNIVCLKSISPSNSTTESHISETGNTASLGYATSTNKIKKQDNNSEQLPSPIEAENTLPGQITQLLNCMQEVCRKIESIEKSIDRDAKEMQRVLQKFDALDKKIQRIEAIPEKIINLENRITLEVQSFKTRIRREDEIAHSLKELTQISSGVYDLLKLTLLNEIVSKT